MIKVYGFDTHADSEFYLIFAEGCDTKEEALNEIVNSEAFEEFKAGIEKLKLNSEGIEERLNRMCSNIQLLSDAKDQKVDIEDAIDGLDYMSLDRVKLAKFDDNVCGSWYMVDIDGNKDEYELDSNVQDFNEDIASGAEEKVGYLLWGYYLFG